MVDQIDRHAISAVLHIAKELDKDNEADWSMEVIGYDGKHEFIKLRQMQMLMYESAKLIHGWPFKYQVGRSSMYRIMHGVGVWEIQISLGRRPRRISFPLPPTPCIYSYI